ncbi:hypothetical protein GCM10011371_18970 [Novosphingobium marinum]|uniref:Uncharacterized protein n=1 Tax=Novosphingobium marinum TaxID=1514948 RepID=A0A7Y9XWT7_9SPHN|nr:hypothetical protein [Novosphingobium marinum]NYH96009.1 hypothetical protein [Novosphingobium marinum]GGC31719.1 hypothetical protein GCM10011371_18970 [Novosphingobium marinum]
MERKGDEVHVSEDEARSGSTPHIVRYVLIISLVLAILALSAIWITGALTSADETGGFNDTERAAQEAEMQE